MAWVKLVDTVLERWSLSLEVGSRALIRAIPT